MSSSSPPPDRSYWLLVGDVPSGPFTVEQVHDQLSTEKVTWQTRACPVGGSTWLPLVQTPGLGPTVAPEENPSIIPASPRATLPCPPHRDVDGRQSQRSQQDGEGGQTPRNGTETTSLPPGRPGDPVVAGKAIAGMLGLILGLILGAVNGGLRGAFFGWFVGGFVGWVAGAGIGWVLKQVDPGTRTHEETLWTVGGYICASTALLLCPPLFGIAGLAIGIRNLNIPVNVTHGRIQIGLSIACGLLGMCFWGMFFAK